MKKNLHVGIAVFACMVAFFACQSEHERSQATVPTPTDTVLTMPKNMENHPITPDYDSAEWVELLDLDPTFVIDVRYATDSNFVGEAMYPCGRCFLRPKVAEALQQAHQSLRQQGYGGLKIFDGYRPRPIQQKLWDKMPDARFVTPPQKGSMHNRGAAVDLTIVDSLGVELDMGTPFDFFGKEAFPSYRHLPDTVLFNRKLLKKTMETYGFQGITSEWWHFSYYRRQYPISDWVWDCTE